MEAFDSLAGKTHVPYKGTATPGNAETVVLFSTTTAFGPRCAPHYQCYICDVALSTQAAAGTQNVRLQKSDDGGVNWLTVGTPTTVGTGVTVASFSVQPYQDWRILYTNGTSAQSAFTADLSIDHTSR